MNKKPEIGARVKMRYRSPNQARIGTVVDEPDRLSGPEGVRVLYDDYTEAIFQFIDTIEPISPVEELALLADNKQKNEH